MNSSSNYGIRSKIRSKIAPDDEFFAEGNIARENFAKLWIIDYPNINSILTTKDNKTNCLDEMAFFCQVPSCQHSFTSSKQYDDHYSSAHCHTCIECDAILSSDRWLHIHIQEQHDPYFAVLSQRQKMYECLVEGCTRKFKHSYSRTAHLRDFHKFSASFNFGSRGVRYASDIKNQHRRSSKQQKKELSENLPVLHVSFGRKIRKK